MKKRENRRKKKLINKWEKDWLFTLAVGMLCTQV